MSLPKVIILDRDGTLCVSSSDPASPFYYVTELDNVILKPGVVEACRVIALHGVHVTLATKQRGLSKGLVSKETVDLINARVARLCGLDFDRVLVEPELENKKRLYEAVLAKNPSIVPQDIHLFDDNEDERIIAARMGITTHDASDLWAAVCRAFKLR